MDFQDLFQDDEQMTAQIDKENVGMPRLQRTINQMLETNKLKLAKSTNYMKSDVNEINASILIAAKSIGKFKQKLTCLEIYIIFSYFLFNF